MLAYPLKKKEIWKRNKKRFYQLMTKDYSYTSL